MRVAAVARLEPLDVRPEEELARFIDATRGAGAVVSFVGMARPISKCGDPVTGLFLDHYPGMTEASLQRIADDGLARFDVSHVRVVHRCGDVLPGEAIVFAAAASRHRRAAFLAADYLMDRLKTEAMFWKKEQGPSGARWIEPSEADRADADRWSD